MPGNPDEPAPSTDELIAAGRHLDAARAAHARGDYARAAELFEKLWDFRGAYEAARAAGDLPRALRYAIDLGDDATVRATLAELAAADAAARAALEVLARLRRHADAAPLAERLGDVDRAIELYGRAHDELNAARLLEAAGRDREAGRMLERA